MARRLMNRALFISIIAVILAGTGCSPGHKLSPVQVATSIRVTYDSAVSGFEVTTQRHYAVRMYRITGERAYEKAIQDDVMERIAELKRDMQQVADSDYRASRCREIRGDLNSKSRKGSLRLSMFEQFDDIDFYLNMLYNANQMHEYCLDSAEEYSALFEESVALLRRVDFREFLLDTAVIRAYAPQAVNYVYYLLDLGVVDLRGEYENAFRLVFDDERDNDLSLLQYRDKIYGLTHFITAASRYYQQRVDSGEFSWVLTYFSHNLSRILNKTKADIVAEVGICYLLAGRTQDPAADECRKFIVDQYKLKARMIPSSSGKTTLESGEHRNVLAYMLLSWPEGLAPGPCLR